MLYLCRDHHAKEYAKCNTGCNLTFNMASEDCYLMPYETYEMRIVSRDKVKDREVESVFLIHTNGSIGNGNI